MWGRCTILKEVKKAIHPLAFAKSILAKTDKKRRILSP
ncbi:hypothetical protein IPdc08_01231 [archaeon]|nr:hypothetical protein IPdc08_01231 [archaeon]